MKKWKFSIALFFLFLFTSQSCWCAVCGKHAPSPKNSVLQALIMGKASTTSIQRMLENSTTGLKKTINQFNDSGKTALDLVPKPKSKLYRLLQSHGAKHSIDLLFFEAIKRGDTKRSLQLFREGADPKIVDENGNNIFHIIAIYQHTVLLRSLFEEAAMQDDLLTKKSLPDINQLNKKGKTALELVIKSVGGIPEIVYEFLRFDSELSVINRESKPLRVEKTLSLQKRTQRTVDSDPKTPHFTRPYLLKPSLLGASIGASSETSISPIKQKYKKYMGDTTSSYMVCTTSSSSVVEIDAVQEPFAQMNNLQIDLNKIKQEVKTKVQKIEGVEWINYYDYLAVEKKIKKLKLKLLNISWEQVDEARTIDSPLLSTYDTTKSFLIKDIDKIEKYLQGLKKSRLVKSN